MNYKKIFWFIGLLLGLYGLITAVFSFISFGEGNELWEEISQMFAYLWAPGIAAAIVQMGIYKESMTDLGLIRKYMNQRWYWIAAILPYIAMGGTLLIVFLFGNLLDLPGFGEIIYTFSEVLQLEVPFTVLESYPLSDYTQELGVFDTPPEVLILFVVLLVMGLILGPNLYILFTLGEEIGWRGLMTVETRKLGYWESNIMVGGLWGLSFLPLIMLSGGGLAEIPVEEILVLIGFCISTSFSMTYLNYKANSVGASAAFRGVLNFIIPASNFWVVGGSELIGSMTGLAGISFFLLLAYGISKYDPEFIENYTTCSFAKPTAEQPTSTREAGDLSEDEEGEQQ